MQTLELVSKVIPVEVFGWWLEMNTSQFHFMDPKQILELLIIFVPSD